MYIYIIKLVKWPTCPCGNPLNTRIVLFIIENYLFSVPLYCTSQLSRLDIYISCISGKEERI